MKFCIYCNKRITGKYQGPYFHVGCKVDAFEIIGSEISVKLWKKMYGKWGV